MADDIPAWSYDKRGEGNAVAAGDPSLADRLFDKLLDRIQSGAMPPDSRFPTQKEIAEQERVSRTVVREAVARLTARGLTRSRQGLGVFVSANAGYRAFQIMPDELAELSEVIKLLEMRLAIEAEMAAYAAARRTTADITALIEALRRMDACQDDVAAAAAADRDFHTAIARATQNDYYVRLVDFIGLRLVPARDLYLRDQPPQAHADYAALVRAEHEAILDAIIRMDPVTAREAARRHMQESLTRHSRLSAAFAMARAVGANDR